MYFFDSVLVNIYFYKKRLVFTFPGAPSVPWSDSVGFGRILSDSVGF